MLIIWFICWMLSDFPKVGIPHLFSDQWNAWGVSLIILIVFYLLPEK